MRLREVRTKSKFPVVRCIDRGENIFCILYTKAKMLKGYQQRLKKSKTSQISNQDVGRPRSCCRGVPKIFEANAAMIPSFFLFAEDCAWTGTSIVKHNDGLSP